jgi:nicotinamide phosphoribosyltransferase
MSILTNRLLQTDSYKLSHFAQYPENTKYISSYIEARGSSVEGVNETVFFGLQAFVKDFLLTPFTLEEILEAKEFAEIHGEPFNLEGWLYILNRHSGFLPLHIEAIAEGTVVPVGIPLVQVINTDDHNCAWLTSYFEPTILSSVWYGTTVATISYACKKAIKAAMEKSCDTLDGLPFKLHDFGFRGAAPGAAKLGGAAHLINFMGTDTIQGIGGAMHYYNAEVKSCGFSIPAAEHSTMTIRGKEGEKACFQQMIDAYAKPGGLFAVVSDGYDIYNAVKNEWINGGLLDQVKAKGAKVVIRPDSGDPLVVPVDIIEMLWDGTPEKLVNTKGYKVLPPYVGVIQGDGINVHTLPKILDNLLARGFSADNIAFGMGGGLLQQVNRDTFKFAMKASSGNIAGKDVDIFKDPVTDSGKKSKRGRFAVVKDAGVWKTMRKQDYFALGIDAPLNQLQTVYDYSKNNRELRLTTFAEVRARAAL